MFCDDRQHACYKALLRVLLYGHGDAPEPELDEGGMPKRGACTGADEQSAQLCQQLLEVDVAPLPGNADQLQMLLESGIVPVTKVGSCFCALFGLLNMLSLQPGYLCKGRCCVYPVKLVVANLLSR